MGTSISELRQKIQELKVDKKSLAQQVRRLERLVQAQADTISVYRQGGKPSRQMRERLRKRSI